MAGAKPMSSNDEQVANDVVDREEPLGLCHRFKRITSRFTSGSGPDRDDSRARVSRLLNAISGLTDKL